MVGRIVPSLLTRKSAPRSFPWAAGVLLGFFAGTQAPGLVISEIQYEPPGNDESLEFLELSNETSTPEDISGYSFVEGIAYTFPPATILKGGGVIVVAANAAALRASYGIDNVVGDFTGRLDNSGERVTLVNQAGIVVQSVRYRARGKWPVSPAGTGHTLSLRSLRLDPKEPESWVQSLDLEGSPGLPNFGGGAPEPVDRDILALGALWRYAKGVGPFSSPADAWVDPAFDDSGWLEGPSGLGYGDDDDATVLADMNGGYASLAIRKRFSLTESDLTGGEVLLSVDYDDAFCAYLNGVEVGRANCSPAGPIAAWDDSALASHEAGEAALVPLPKQRLVAGENVLAIVGYNLGVASSDFSLAPRVLVRTTPGGAGVSEETLLGRGDDWNLRKGTAPFSNPPSEWRQPGFDDASWTPAPAGFGYVAVGAGTVAFEVPASTIGNQDFDGALGMDFDVLQPVTVTQLGVFDSGGDGLNRTITSHLYNRSSHALLATIEFSGANPGTLLGGSRFQPLVAPIDLPAGFQGTIVAEGYGPDEPNGNQGISPLGLTTNDGAGLLSFVGLGRYGMAPGEFPPTEDSGPENRYAAGTFLFQPQGAQGQDVVAPPGVSTLLDDMRGSYTSIACRAAFEVTDADLSGSVDFVLGLQFDDGFCAFLNGVELARANCGAPGSEPEWNDVATGVAVGGGERLFQIPRDALHAGTNTLAIAGFNSNASDPSFSLAPRLLRRRVTGAAGGAGTVTFNELGRGAAQGQGWIELYNPQPIPADLSGHRLAVAPTLASPYVIPQGTAVPAHGFLVLTELATGLSFSSTQVQVFLLAEDGRAVAAAAFDRAPPAGAALGTWSEARAPDGGSQDYVSRTPTPGSANAIALVRSIVINEIFYHPPEHRLGEFVELFHRGGAPVDLSGFRFSDGIDYTFPNGTELEAGEYLVLAQDPAFISATYGVQALGPYVGNLSDQGESLRLVDRDGNLVDEVRYYDSGRWPRWADGGGSSLELIDPSQENDFGSAWEASDESTKADWEELSFHVSDYVPATESELHLYLAERGECFVDDVSIRRSGGANLVPNGGFESTLTQWILGGTHVRSARTTAESHSGGASLAVVASGKGDTLVNRIEVETSPALTAGPYDVSLWARWARGASLLIAHGEYSPGPFRVTPCFTCGTPEPNLSGNPLSAPLRMTIPANLGTPGAENGAARRLREATGSDNLGPVGAELRHSPAVPAPGAPVSVTVRLADSDGVASARVLFRTGSADGAMDSVDLLDDGLHGDGLEGDGMYGASLPGYASGTKVVFFVEAADSKGATRRLPVDAPETTCLYQVLPQVAGSSDRFVLVLDATRTAELQTRQLHSNDLVDGAFVFDDETVHYNIGVRYRGSPWGRPSLLSYAVRFPSDAPFLRGLDGINISKTGVSINEAAAMFLMGRNGEPGHPSPAPDYLFARGWFNGSALGMKGLIEPIDGSFLEKWLGEDAVGPLLKAYGRFVFNDGGGIVGQSGWEGASFIYRGDDSENYRGYFGHAAERSDDVWEPLFRLTGTLDPGVTTNADFDREVGSIVDLDGFFRVFGARILISDCDAFGVNNGHNGHIAFNSVTGLWWYFPFDVECSFVSAGPNLFGSADPSISRLLSRPPSRRAYLKVLARYLDGYWSAKSSPLLDALGSATGYNAGAVKGHVGTVAGQVRSAIQSFRSTPFRITTNGGNDLTVDGATVDLEGDASIDVETLLVSLNGRESVVLEPLWTTVTRWKATFALDGERTEIDIIGIDGDGNAVGSATIAVTTTARPPVTLTSIEPTSGPAVGGTRVTLRGAGFAIGIRVFFGGVEASGVTILSSSEAAATTPPAPAPFPAGGRVDVAVTLAATRVELPDAFTYEGGAIFRRGEVNGDGKVDISDAVVTLVYLFAGGQNLPCVKAADIDDGGTVNISDPIQLLGYLFLSGQPPAEPREQCGPDATADSLDCAGPGACGG